MTKNLIETSELVVPCSASFLFTLHKLNLWFFTRDIAESSKRGKQKYCTIHILLVLFLQYIILILGKWERYKPCYQSILLHLKTKSQWRYSLSFCVSWKDKKSTPVFTSFFLLIKKIKTNHHCFISHVVIKSIAFPSLNLSFENEVKAQKTIL